MGITAYYCQIDYEKQDEVLSRVKRNSQEYYDILNTSFGIITRLGIDKSWQFMVEVFKDIPSNIDFNANLGQVVFYGEELHKQWEYDGLLNFTKTETVHQIYDFLRSLNIQSKDRFIEVFNSTAYTRFGKIDYSEYFDYLYLHYQNLENFYKECQNQNSGVLVSIS